MEEEKRILLCGDRYGNEVMVICWGNSCTNTGFYTFVEKCKGGGEYNN